MTIHPSSCGGLTRPWRLDWILRLHPLWLGLLLGLVTRSGSAQTKLLRFPDISGDRVVFCYAGDLWKAPATGGLANRLTAHPGQELFPKFSPDGQWIAFTGQYDGDEQVYVMPAAGGMPKQLTYYPARGPLAPRWGFDNQVYGWTPDGKRILFRSLRDADGGRTLTALYTVDREGGLPTPLPMPTSGAGDFSPDGKRLVYSPLFRDFRTWKRYEGGWAQDLYLFDLETHQARRIAASPRSERDPMWIGNTICFASDRDGTLNLYAYDTERDSVEPLTRSRTWDVRWPSSDNQSRIVYESNGELRLFHIDSRLDQPIAITVPDDGLARRPSRHPAYKNIEEFGLSPKGERALFVARGDLFSAPIEKGPTRNLTRTSQAHDKGARWSPDGARIVFISDLSGEEQLYLVNQDGSQPPEPLTSHHRAMLYTPEWAPDGQRLAYSDKDGKLYVLTLQTKTVREIADAPRGGISDYAWSPGGGHLAFSQAEPNGFRSLFLWSAPDGPAQRVTSEMFDVHSPAWDPEGKYLFYLSRRQFAPQMSTVEWNFAGNRDEGIFALALRKDVPDPFAPESDEVTLGNKEKEAGQSKKETDEADQETDEAAKNKTEPDPADKDTPSPKPKEPIRIDVDGLAQRSFRVPIPADNLGGLSAIKGHLLYTAAGARFYGRESYEKRKLNIFSMKERKSSVLVEDMSDYALSDDRTKVLVREKDQYNLYDAKPKAKEKKTVSTQGLMVDRVPAQEWAQIFQEVWRRYRDFFYVTNMHGYDWKALGDRYRPLIQHVAHRSDLNYLLGEMVAELNVGHAYIEGGDFEIPDRPKVGLPGARFELDPASGRYRIARVFQGQNEEEKYRAPLTEVGLNVREGDFLLAIDGEELRGSDNPYRLLLHKTDPVTLTLNSKPDREGARQVTYQPIFSEASLLYLQWILENQKKVSRMTDGKVGYLHIPNMGADGIYEFIKWYYPQIRKEGLIVDVRSNGGGNVSQWIIERLDNKLLGTRFGYDGDEPRTYPDKVFHGHMVCLISETSASDGDIFPHRFRQAGLGPLIGKRTWGGVVGISGRGPLIDGGQVFVPLQATNDPEGNWIIEGHGVEPDIEVDNDPSAVIAGGDPQLERGVAEILRRIQEKPMHLPARPPDPVKTK